MERAESANSAKSAGRIANVGVSEEIPDFPENGYLDIRGMRRNHGSCKLCWMDRAAMVEQEMRAYYSRLARRLSSAIGMDDHFKDLEQVARLALWEATFNWDPARNGHFGKASLMRVRGAMKDYLRTCKPGFNRRKKTVPAHFSIDVQGTNFKDTLSDNRQSIEDHLVDNRELPDGWDSELNERSALLIRLHYLEEIPMKQVGRRLGIHESRVSQLADKARERLRESLQNHSWLSAPKPKRSLKYHEAKA